MKTNIEISYCYFFNCVHNENGNCLKSPVKIGYHGTCLYKTLDKHNDLREDLNEFLNNR